MFFSLIARGSCSTPSRSITETGWEWVVNSSSREERSRVHWASFLPWSVCETPVRTQARIPRTTSEVGCQATLNPLPSGSHRMRWRQVKVTRRCNRNFFASERAALLRQISSVQQFLVILSQGAEGYPENLSNIICPWNAPPPWVNTPGLRNLKI